jgi:serine/threonine protein kinase
MKNEINKTFKSKLIFGKYSIKYLISKGSFGEVYLGTNVLNNKDYAIKMERTSKGESLLKEEAYVLLFLKGPGLPNVITFGISGRYHILIENLLGKSIYNIWLEKEKKFNIKDTCMFAIQALERVEYVHSKNYLHRDIKPANFLVGNPDQSQIYLIDFGNARKYRSSRTGKHLPFSRNYKIYGTTIFLSLNVLKGIEQTRKDELESLGLVIIYLYKGYLPWSNYKFKDIFQALEKIKAIKENLSMKQLCHGLPIEMFEYMNYIKNMNFEDTPDYRYLQSLFLNILKKIGEKNDLFFSWVDKSIVPKKLTSRSNSRSIQKLYNDILRSHSSKKIINSNTDVTRIKTLDNQFLNPNNNMSNFLEINSLKKIPILDDNQINSIYSINTNEKKVNKRQTIIPIDNKQYNTKKLNIFRTIDNNNYIKKSETIIDNRKLRIIKLGKRKKENLNLSYLKSKNKFPISINNKTRSSKNSDFNLNKHINYFTKIDNKKTNNINLKPKLNLKNYDFEFEHSNMQYKKRSSRNCINIKNININKLPNNNYNYTYVTIFKKLDTPKINILTDNNAINQDKIKEIKEYKTKFLNKEQSYKNRFSPKPFDYYTRNSLYKSIFISQSDLNKKLPDFTKKLINERKKNSYRTPLNVQANKLKGKFMHKSDKRKYVIQQQNFQNKSSLNSKIIFYNPFYHRGSFNTFSKSPNHNLQLNLEDI